MLTREFSIGGRKVGGCASPYLIAEAGSNHNQSLDVARRLIDAAADAACDAVKFQLFEASELYPLGHELYDIFKSLELSPDWLPQLQQHASDRGIAFFASVFDRRSADRLAAIDAPAYKIASSETTKLPLLAYVARKGKPLIISTGMCDLMDIMEAMACCERNMCHEVALLQCVSLYPQQTEDSNLAVMDTLVKMFDCPVGYSDHALGTLVSVAAAARGAAVIEKHFTLDRSGRGPDHFYALEPAELSEMVRQIREVHAAIGSAMKTLHPIERKLGRREGLYVAKPVVAGQVLSADAVAVRRPAVGIRARHRDEVIGLRAARDLAIDEAIGWEDVQP